MFKKTALVAGIGLALSVTAQADYRWELGGDYTMGQTDTDIKNRDTGSSRSNDVDSDVGRLNGTWYFENVDTSKGPLSEAAFLDHASSITVFGSDGEIQLSQVENGNLNDEDGQRYGADMRYVAEGPGWKLSGWLVDMGYNRFEPGDLEINNYNLGIGNYVTPNTTVIVNYEMQSLSGGSNLNEGGDVDTWSLDLEHMFLMSNGGFKARASAGRTLVSDRDDVDTYLIGGTWYFTNNIGIGADYLNTGAGGYEIQGWRVNSEWFINEAFAVNLGYGQLDPDDIDFNYNNGDRGRLEQETDVLSLGAKVRF
jgi:hypothetical protein